MAIENVTTTTMSMSLLTQSVDRLTAQYAALQGQLTSGVVSDTYGGLGDQRNVVLNLQPQITKVDAWQGNITSAQNTLSVTQTAMSRITTIVTNLQTSLISLRGDNNSTTVSLAALQARQSLTELASLLNTQNGSQYVFGGNASDAAPVADPSSITTSSFFQKISASVAGVAANGATATEDASMLVAVDNTSGQSVFSGALSVDATTAATIGHSVTVGDQQHVTVGFVATQGGAASATSTGSSIRDLMRILAVVGSLDQADASSAGFSTLVGDTASQMQAVSSSLNLTVASLGQTQTQLTTQGSSLGQISSALTKQLGLVKESDPTALSTQLAMTQSQLQASYSLIADMKGMSLAAYL